MVVGEIPLVLMRGVADAAVLFQFGALMALVWLLPPVLSALGPTGGQMPRRMERLAWSFLGAAIVATLGWLLLQSGMLGGSVGQASFAGRDTLWPFGALAAEPFGTRRARIGVPSQVVCDASWRSGPGDTGRARPGLGDGGGAELAGGLHRAPCARGRGVARWAGAVADDRGGCTISGCGIGIGALRPSGNTVRSCACGYGRFSSVRSGRDANGSGRYRLRPSGALQTGGFLGLLAFAAHNRFLLTPPLAVGTPGTAKHDIAIIIGVAWIGIDPDWWTHKRFRKRYHYFENLSFMYPDFRGQMVELVRAGRDLSYCTIISGRRSQSTASRSSFWVYPKDARCTSATRKNV